jgi:chromate transporter
LLFIPLAFYSYRVVVDLYRLGDVAIIAGIFYGIKPAVAAIVLQAARRIGSRALKHGAHWAIAAAAFVAVFALNVPFPVIVISAAITGFIGGRIARKISQRQRA